MIEKGKFTDLVKQKSFLIKQDDFIRTGFNSIDEIIEGFLPKKISIIAGRPAIGKTSLMLNIAININENTNVLFVNLEKSLNYTIKRILSCNIKQNEIAKAENLYLMSLSGEISLIIENIESFIIDNNIKLVFIDYVQLINDFSKISSDIILQKLENFADINNISIVLSSQLDKSGEENEVFLPSSSDLQDINTTNNIDKVLLIYRPEYYGFYEDSEGETTKGLANIIISQNRNGQIGLAKIFYKDIACDFFEL